MNDFNIWLQRLAVGGVVFLVFLAFFYLLSLLLPLFLLGFVIYWGIRLGRTFWSQKLKPEVLNGDAENPAYHKSRKPEIIDVEYEIIDDGKKL